MWRGWWILVAVATALACTVASAGAAPLRWSAAHTVDAAQGVTLGSLQCPSATQCTALDLGGDEVMFDPTKSSPPPAVNVDAAADPGGAEAADAIACPSTAQCVIVDGKGNAVVFDPANPSGAGTTSLNPGEDFG
jgi:hypothetical protein